MNKQLISETGNYRVYAEMIAPVYPSDSATPHLRFFSEWNGNTEMRFEMVLTSDAKQRLLELLSTASQGV